MLSETVVRVLDRVENRYFGKYTAFVKDNADPENRGRLRLTVPAVLGSTVVSGWALPCAPFGGQAGQGLFFIPDSGAGVWVEFEGGDPDYPIWVGTFWSKPGGTTEVPKPADSQSPPTSKIIATQKHIIEFADADGSEAITITDSTNKNVVTLDANGISIEDQNGNVITLTSSGVDVADGNGNEISLTSSGVDITDANGNEIALASAGTTISSSAIKLGQGAAESMVLGTMLESLLSPFFSLLASHTHPTSAPGAPTAPALPPLVPPVLTGALSQKHKVE
jgi:uncharacterized protein involved in type VI secretion and phage assembly